MGAKSTGASKNIRILSSSITQSLAKIADDDSDTQKYYKRFVFFCFLFRDKTYVTLHNMNKKSAMVRDTECPVNMRPFLLQPVKYSPCYCQESRNKS